MNLWKGWFQIDSNWEAHIFWWEGPHGDRAEVALIFCVSDEGVLRTCRVNEGKEMWVLNACPLCDAFWQYFAFGNPTDS